jgi:hypothetical protein
MGAHVPDALTDSRVRLERLLQQIMNEKDSATCDELAAEIWRVLRERDYLKTALAIQKRLNPK